MYGTKDVYESNGAIYNAFGQRLRDDLFSRPNPSDCEEEWGDMSGYESAMGFDN